jgi:hypothetical protein
MVAISGNAKSRVEVCCRCLDTGEVDDDTDDEKGNRVVVAVVRDVTIGTKAIVEVRTMRHSTVTDCCRSVAWYLVMVI